MDPNTPKDVETPPSVEDLEFEARHQASEDARILLEVPPAPESAELQENWDELREALKLPRLSDDELRKFIDDFLSDRIFTSALIGNEEAAHVLPMVFMPIALGCFSKVQPESLKQIGLIWEYRDKAGPRSINGRPVFFSFHLIHIDDWERAKPIIVREQERRKNIDL